MTLAVPKPQRPARDPKYLDRVRQLPCCACGRFPSQAHHPISGRYAQRKVTDHDAIPLCSECHDYRHANPAAFALMHGDETGFVALTRAAVDRLKRDTIGGRS